MNYHFVKASNQTVDCTQKEKFMLCLLIQFLNVLLYFIYCMIQSTCDHVCLSFCHVHTDDTQDVGVALPAVSPVLTWDSLVQTVKLNWSLQLCHSSFMVTDHQYLKWSSVIFSNKSASLSCLIHAKKGPFTFRDACTHPTFPQTIVK